MKKVKISKTKANELTSKILENKAKIKVMEAENQEAIASLEAYVEGGGTLVLDRTEILVKKNPGQLVWPEAISETPEGEFPNGSSTAGDKAQPDTIGNDQDFAA